MSCCSWRITGCLVLFFLCAFTFTVDLESRVVGRQASWILTPALHVVGTGYITANSLTAYPFPPSSPSRSSPCCLATPICSARWSAARIYPLPHSHKHLNVAQAPTRTSYNPLGPEAPRHQLRRLEDRAQRPRLREVNPPQKRVASVHFAQSPHGTTHWPHLLRLSRQ